MTLIECYIGSAPDAYSKDPVTAYEKASFIAWQMTIITPGENYNW